MRIVHAYEKLRGVPPGPTPLIAENGQVYFCTGRDRGNECYRRAEKRCVGLPRGHRHGTGHNFIVEATLRLEDDCFIDVDTGWPYLSVDDSLHSILNAVADGTLRHEGGRISGLFTFKPHSWGQAYMAIRAHRGPIPAPKPAKRPARRAADPAADAPDLSDFVKTLGREG